MSVYRTISLHVFSSIWVAETQPFGKKLLIRLTICSFCVLTICKFSYFPFWVLKVGLGSDCLIS